MDILYHVLSIDFIAGATAKCNRGTEEGGEFELTFKE